jgi:hypothetical protein
MEYAISGEFIETCDCFLMCPCWVDDDPDEGHCTGLFAWRLGERSAIDGVDVAGRTVVSVSTHTGNRRGGGTTTALFIDADADTDQMVLLGQAFSGELGGPLSDLAAVSGAVLQRERARIAIEPDGESWAVTVSGLTAGGSGEPAATLVHAAGVDRIFEGEDEPLVLRRTALAKELGVPAGAEVTAQQGEQLAIHLAALPGAYVEVTGRSGMRGRFTYRFSE